MKILGIDQSYTSAGYCILDENGDVEVFGTIKTTPSDGDIFDRSVMITKHLVDIYNENDVKYIALEGLAFGSRGNATRDLAGLQFTIVNKFRENPSLKSLKIVAPTSVKRFAVKRKGKVEKKDLYESLPELTKNKFVEKGFKKSSGLYDVTDAYWIAKYTQENSE